MKLVIDGQEFQIEAKGDTITVNGVSFTVKVEGEGVNTSATVDGKRFKVHRLGEAGEVLELNVDGKIHRIAAEGVLRVAAKPAAPRGHKRVAADAASAGSVTALMPGRVAAVKVAVGQRVEVGDTLLVLEAMKMENDIKAAMAGIVKAVNVKRGASVVAGEVLVVIE